VLMVMCPAHGLGGRELCIVAWFDNIPFGTEREAVLRKQSCYERLYEIENFDKLIFEIVDEKSLCMFHY
jgi:hypothetical protein